MKILLILTTLLSSFLLFVIEPMTGKILLPFFGGNASIWNTVILFFMVMLFLGYLYVVMIDKLKLSQQILVHCGLIILATISIFLPQFPLKSSSHPLISILQWLFVSYGPTTFILATTSTLLQTWLSSFMRKPAYYLYAFSNTGSLLALLTYPIIIEPFSPLNVQQLVWKGCFIFYLILLIYLEVNFAKLTAIKKQVSSLISNNISLRSVLLWTGISALTNTVLIATTTHLAQDVSPAPFLWLLPLTLFLVSYIIPFSLSHAKKLTPPHFLAPFIVAVYIFIFREIPNNYGILLASEMLMIFTVFLLLHSELFNLRPAKQGLSLYYLAIGAGGVVASLFCIIVAPLIFPGLWEFPLSLLVSLILIGSFLFASPKPPPEKLLYPVMCVVVIVLFYYNNKTLFQHNPVLSTNRNFYGITTITEQKFDNGIFYREMLNGTISHGEQYLGSKDSNTPLAYYTKDSGVGLSLINLEKTKKQPLNIGAVGLGVGTIAAYCEAGDSLRFYEINPAVIRYANTYFSYLSECQKRGGLISIIEGDARVSLTNELANGNKNEFDILVVDAFTGDSIPTHLMTDEALQIYLKNLKENGIIAYHITNHYLNLLPALHALAKKHDLFISLYEDEKSASESSWVMLSREVPTNAPFEYTKTISPVKTVQPWTDNYSNLIQALIW